MSKKVLFVNPISAGGTSLDTTKNPHDVEDLGVAEAFEADGYEVWLHEPYVQKSKQSSWPRTIAARGLSSAIDHFDAIVIHVTASGLMKDSISYGFSMNPWITDPRLSQFVTMFPRYGGEVFFFLPDPRDCHLWLAAARPEDFQLAVERSKITHREAEDLAEAFQRSKILWQGKYWDSYLSSSRLDSKRLDVLRLKEVVRCTYGGAIGRHLVGGRVSTVNDPEYDFTHAGSKNQTVTRRKRLLEMYANCSVGLIGDINLKGFPSLTDFKKVDGLKVRELSQLGTAMLYTNEEGHARAGGWITPRLFQCLEFGSICLVDSQADPLNELQLGLHVSSNQDVQNWLGELASPVHRRSVYEQQLYQSSLLKEQPSLLIR